MPRTWIKPNRGKPSVRAAMSRSNFTRDGLKPIVSFVEKPLLFKIFVCPNKPLEDRMWNLFSITKCFAPCSEWGAAILNHQIAPMMLKRLHDETNARHAALASARPAALAQELSLFSQQISWLLRAAGGANTRNALVGGDQSITSSGSKLRGSNGILSR